MFGWASRDQASNSSDSGCDGPGRWLSPCTFNATETVANQTVSDNRIVEACDRVTAGPRLVVDPSGDLTLRAGNRVVIENGVVIQGRLAVIVDPLLAIE